MRALGSSFATCCLEPWVSNMNPETVVIDASLWVPEWPWEGHGPAVLVPYLSPCF